VASQEKHWFADAMCGCTASGSPHNYPRMPDWLDSSASSSGTCCSAWHSCFQTGLVSSTAHRLPFAKRFYKPTCRAGSTRGTCMDSISAAGQMQELCWEAGRTPVLSALRATAVCRCILQIGKQARMQLPFGNEATQGGITPGCQRACKRVFLASTVSANSSNKLSSPPIKHLPGCHAVCHVKDAHRQPDCAPWQGGLVFCTHVFLCGTKVF